MTFSTPQPSALGQLFAMRKQQGAQSTAGGGTGPQIPNSGASADSSQPQPNSTSPQQTHQIISNLLGFDPSTIYGMDPNMINNSVNPVSGQQGANPNISGGSVPQQQNFLGIDPANGGNPSFMNMIGNLLGFSGGASGQ